MSTHPIEILRAAGLANPRRVAGLIRDTVAALRLDLRGLTVLTEAASGPFVVTPVIAAAAGADRVIALTRHSRYATVRKVIAQTRSLEAICGLNKGVEMYNRRRSELFAAADIVTNLGFVRPLDRKAINQMRHGSVIALMCEAWELRSADIDLSACKARGVRVLATNESAPEFNVFAYSGWLCVKLLLEAGIEIHRNRILVVGSDKFGRTIRQLLLRTGVRCVLVNRLTTARVRNADAIVVADYTRTDRIIGDDGDIRAAELAAIAPGITVVQFAGRVDVRELQRHNIAVHPGIDLPHRRMAVTLGGLGSRPVVELHAAGLKVGELALKAEIGKPGTSFNNLPQTITEIIRTRSA